MLPAPAGTLHKIELDGKKKTRKVDVLLRAGNEEYIIKYPEKVDS